jgi:hypothetical protein
MDDAVVVGELQPSAYLDADAQSGIQRQAVLRRLVDLALDVTTAHQLRYDKRLAEQFILARAGDGVLPAGQERRLLTQVEDGHDVRV